MCLIVYYLLINILAVRMKIYNVLDGGVVVIGPILLDRYIQCDVNKIDQTSPAPVGRVVDTNEKPGAAGNVVANLCALGVPSTILSVVGNDDAGRKVNDILSHADIDRLIYEAHAPGTSVKTRLVDARNQIFCRFDEEGPFANDSSVESVLIPALDKSIVKNHPKVLVLSDYAKGVITPMIARKAIEIADELGMATIVDPVPEHQMWYENATVVTPNIHEARAMVGSSEELHPFELAKEITQIIRCDNVLITAGADGMYLVSDSDVYEPMHLKTAGTLPVDTTGAGDTVVAGLAAGLHAGYDIVRAAKHAISAAEIVIGKPGTAVATKHEIFKQQAAVSSETKIVSLEKAAELAASVKQEKGVLAVTNGVFDLLHLGHVTLLEGAAEDADFLIVLVNSDSSVVSAKKKKPVQPEMMRAELLAKNPNVDAVVIFSDKTPLELIKVLQPNILVKGSDYTKETVVGGNIVKTWKGKVKIVEGDKDSTSKIIKRILNRKNN